MAQSKLELLLSLKNKMSSGLTEARKKLKTSLHEMKTDINDLRSAHTNAFTAMKAEKSDIARGLKPPTDLFDKMSSGFDGAKKRIRAGLSEMKADLNNFKQSHIEAFSAIREQVPGLDSALSLLANPYALAAAAVIGLGVALYKSVDAAADFNHEFVNLRNLNLDKSNAELDKLKGNILDLSLKTGLSAKATSKAYYDVQSATGLYGKEVDMIVEKVGNFSIATQADLSDSINSSTKAMKAFGFGAEKMDDYLASNAKTVQVGITTFNELAQVQTEYAGAAASIGQDFNTANKVFAAFTAIAKDSSTAATMTKSAFEGLTQKATIDGLKGIGVDLFDASGKMKNMDGVIKELVPKIQNMSDADFAKFKNQIGGPEGLQNLFKQLRTSGDDVLKTFEAFDNTTFSIDDALKNAKGDLNTLKMILGNQINNIMIRIGETILPYIIKGFATVTDYISKGVTFLKDLYNRSELLQDIVEGVGWVLDWFMLRPVKLIFSYFGWIGDSIQSIYEKLGGEGNPLEDFFKGLESGYLEFKDNLMGIQSMFKAILEVGKAVANIDFTNPDSFKAVETLWNNLDLSQAFDEGKAASKIKRMLNGLTETGAGEPDADKKTSGTKPTVPTGPTGGDQVAKVVGDSHAAKNLTVNIEALHKGNNVIQSQNLPQSITMEQFERMYQELMMRTIRNVEQSF
jgi:TP901 family phage tail tape measure protein